MIFTDITIIININIYIILKSSNIIIIITTAIIIPTAIILLLLLLVLLLSSILLLLLLFSFPQLTTRFLLFLLRDHNENKAFSLLCVIPAI